MKYMPRDIAFGKLRAMAEGAAILRQEILLNAASFDFRYPAKRSIK
jgi:hypothetical protein